MVKRLAANGASLETIQNITMQFHDILFPDNTPSRLDTELSRDVDAFSKVLKSSLLKSLKGESDSVGLFSEALKQRSALLSNPAIKNQGQGKLSEYLKNIVHLDEGGNVEKSLELTVRLHANALDPRYEGEEISVPSGDVSHASAPIL